MKKKEQKNSNKEESTAKTFLKLKDNIDFKELEKIGFKYNNNTNQYTINSYNSSGVWQTFEFSININCWNRRIKVLTPYYDDKLLSLLFSLIKQDFFELAKEVKENE